MSVVYLNGDYLPADRARISINDRGFLFGDGVYEVTPAYHGRLFRWARHLTRMRKGLAALGIDYDATALESVKRELLARNGLDDVPVAYIYAQVTRGVAPRTHAFPDPPVPPSVYGFANRYVRPAREVWERGYRAITVPDQRWALAEIKAIALLPNCLAQQAAVDAGVSDAIFVRDGIALEGSQNNLFAVFDGGGHHGAEVELHPARGHARPDDRAGGGAGSARRGAGDSARGALPGRRGLLHGDHDRGAALGGGGWEDDRGREGGAGGAGAVR